MQPWITVRKNSMANFIPTYAHYSYKSKYPQRENARRRDHPFKIELDVMLKTRMPAELVCYDHLIAREVPVTVEVPIAEYDYYLTMEYEGIRWVAKVTSEELHTNPRGVIFRLADEFKAVVGRRLSKLTIIEWLKMDMAYYFPQYYPDEHKHVLAVIKASETGTYEPLLIKNIEKVERIVPTYEEELQEREEGESAETFRQELAVVIGRALTPIIEDFLRYEYNFEYAIDFKTEAGVEDLKPECSPTTTDIITTELCDTEPIEDDTEVIEALFLRSNSLDSNPQEYEYWSEEFNEYVNSRLSDVVNEIVEFYKEWCNEKFRGGE